MFPKDQPISDERAVEASQLGQPVPTEASPVNAGYYEPHKLAELTKHGRLYVIADGMSGPTFGQIVSQYAIKKLLHSFYTSDISDPQTRLLEVIRQVNLEIVERNNQFSRRRPMATTLSTALFHNNKLLIANVGDSQAYIVWGQDIERVDWDAPSPSPTSPDDAPILLLPSKTEPLEPDRDKATSSPAQYVPQVLGLDKNIKIDTFTRRLFPADIVILCSGGLTGYLAEKEIARAVSRHGPEQAIPRLIALAAERNNHDPVAISITRVLSSAVALRPPLPMTLPDAPTWSDWDITPKPPSPSPPQPATAPTVQPPLTPTSLPDTKPVMAHRVETTEYPTTAHQLSQQQSGWRWQSSLWGLLIVLFLCVLPFVAWRYLLTPDLVAAIPYLSDLETLFTGQDAPLVPGLTPPESVEPEAISQIEAAPETSAETPAKPTDTPIATLDTTPVAESNSPRPTPVIESNSPRPTPEAVFTRPVSSPTARPLPTLAESPTPSPTPISTIELPEGCTNRARFFGDVTVPDGTQFSAGQKFEKVWLLLNAETCPWGPGYTIRFIGGVPMGAPPELPLQTLVSPQTNSEIRVPMIAPGEPGEYRSEWQLYDLNGEAFGPVMYLEIEVTPPDLTDLAMVEQATLYDFVDKAGAATWSAGGEIYSLLEIDISDRLQLPAPQGTVARGIGLLRGNVTSERNVLLTYPHREFGLIEGSYAVDTPLQPTDVLVAELGFPKLSILSDDGVTFEVIFTPGDGSEQVLLSKTVQYRDSPITEIVSLAPVEPDQIGTFTLRVLGGDSLSQDWAVWIDLRLVRL
jgi:protein phosphatase